MNDIKIVKNTTKKKYDDSSPFTKLIKSFKNFQRGDIIVFRYPIEEDAINCPNGGFIGLTSTYYIKRIIGLPGDKIKLLDKDVYVNGVKISNNIEESKYFLDGENHEVYINRFDVKEIMTIYKEESKRYQENISNLEIIARTNIISIYFQLNF